MSSISSLQAYEDPQAVVLEQQESTFIHPSALVESSLGSNTRVWAFSHIMPNSFIGANCNIGSHCFIESDVIIKENATIKNNNMLFSGVHIGQGAFIATGVVFTNDRYPRSPRLEVVKERYENEDWLLPTHVKEGASVGAGAVLLAGITIGEYAVVAAGALVTKDVSPYALVVGQPAKQRGWMCECGQPLKMNSSVPICPHCDAEYQKTNKGIRRLK